MSQAMTWYQLSDVDLGLIPCNDKSKLSGQLDVSSEADLCPPALRGMAYGDGFFTTIGVYNGLALHLSYHQARVNSHCQALFLDLPQATQNVLWQSIEAQAAHIKHGIIKIIIYRKAQSVRGYGYEAKLESNTALVWVGVIETPQLASQKALFLKPDGTDNSAEISESTLLQQPPITATCLTSQLASWPKPLAGLKSLNRLDGVLIAGELQRLKQAQPEIAEGLVQDMSGNWVEGVMSNVFYQLRSNTSNTSSIGQWYTPPIERAGVNGTMRQAIIDRLDELNQPVILRPLNDEDLSQIHAMFFCNAVRGVMPVEVLVLGDQRLDLSTEPYLVSD